MSAPHLTLDTAISRDGLHLWSTYGPPMVHLWSTSGPPMVHLWSTYGPPLVHLWSTSGPDLERVEGLVVDRQLEDVVPPRVHAALDHRRRRALAAAPQRRERIGRHPAAEELAMSTAGSKDARQQR